MKKELPQNTENESSVDKVMHFFKSLFGDDEAKGQNHAIPLNQPHEEAVPEEHAAPKEDASKKEAAPEEDKAVDEKPEPEQLPQQESDVEKKKLDLKDIEKMLDPEADAQDDGGFGEPVSVTFGNVGHVDSTPRDLALMFAFNREDRIFLPVKKLVSEKPDHPVMILDLTPKLFGGDAVVDEDDLLASRGPGESEGSDPMKESTTVEGDFRIIAPDGVAILTVAGVAVITNNVFTPTAIVTPLGNILDIFDYNPQTGVVTYHYILMDNESHPAGNGENDIFEDFPVYLQDLDGDNASDTLSIRIIDDVPSIAPSEVDAVLVVDESDFAVDAKGNFAVLFNATPGADGATIEYVLGISSNGAASGLVDSLSGKSVLLFLQGGEINGRIDGANGDIVFKISIDAAGEVTLDQRRSVMHDDPTDPDEASSPAMLNSPDLITLTAKITDGDGDEAESTRDIGNAFRFEDDGPSIKVKAVGEADKMEVDETDLSQNASANFADNFATISDFGADGPGTLTMAYELLISASGANSGLVDTATQQSVLLYMNDGVVEGRTAISNDVVFTVSVDANGVVTLDQIRAIVHADGTDPNDARSLLTADLIKLKGTGTIIDKDGDSQSDSATINLGKALVFRDDGPSIEVKAVAAADKMIVDESNLAVNATADFSDNFAIISSNYGADGAGSTSMAYALSISASGANSGLIDTATQQSVFLYMNNGVVEGRTAISNAVVFTVSVDANGIVTLDQIRAIVHPDTTDPDDAKSLLSNDLVKITATGTIIDKDGDSKSASATLNIGQALTFKDDGPSIEVKVVAAADKMIVDETNLGTDATANFADNFSVLSNYGADGAGSTSVAYALSISASGANSGLVDTATLQNVLLYMNGNVVEGRTAGSNVVVFTVSVDAAGVVTLDQKRAIMHPDGTNPDDAKSLLSDDLIKLTATGTIIDKDGDPKSASASLNIGLAFIFKDDGPSIEVKKIAAADKLIVDESNLNVDATANFADNFSVMSNYGADGAGSTSLTYALSISANGANSGLVDTATNQNVLLYMNGNVVEGRTASNVVVFTVSVDAAGNVTLDQKRAIVHPDGTNPDDAKTLLSDDLVKLTATGTITDKDGDSSSASATINLGLALTFKDDGPSIEVKVVAPADKLIVDESNLNLDATANYADNFAVANFNHGADGAGTITGSYALSIPSNGANSGLVDTATNQSVLLYNNNGVIEGRTSLSNAIVFTVSVNSSGTVTLDQQRAIVHPDPTNHDDSKTLLSDDLVKLTFTSTITDKDTDSASSSATINIGQSLIFKDDGPIANDDYFNIEAPPLPSYNLTFVLDVSGSMGTVIPNSGGKTRLQLLKEALTSSGALLDSYQAASTALKISIITFSGDLDGQNSDDATISQEFSSIAAAKSYIDGLSANGWTNYRAAVQQASADIISDSNNPSLNGYIDRLYFISDGKPQPNPIDDPGYSIDNRLTDAEELAWRNLLNANNVEAFMLNIGSTNQADINAHLRDLDDDQPGIVITVNPDLSNLQQLLISTITEVETTGNVLLNDIAGADNGAEVINIFFNFGTAQAASAYLAAHPELVGATANGVTVTIPISNTNVTTPLGNTITMEADGDFKYTSNFGPNSGQDEEIYYTMKDKDGDTDPAKIVFNIDGGVTITNLTPKADGGDAVVDEDDLLANRGPGESAGSDPTKESTTVLGDFNIKAPDGVGSLTIDGVAVITNNVFTAKDINTPLGNVLHILSYDAATGKISYSYTLNDNETHPAGAGENSIFEDFNVVLKDTDNDQTNALLSVRIIDDIPSISVSAVGTADQLVVDETNLSINATADYSDNFLTVMTPGADGVGSTTNVYALSISANNVDSGLDDTATGQNVLLRMNNGVVEGRTQTSNELVFTVSVNQNGQVTLDQIRALVHPDPNNPDEGITLSNSNLVRLTKTSGVTDTDGDSASSSATINIGQALIFKDDAPVAKQDTITITPPPLPSYNLTFVLDVSGSMATVLPNSGGKTRLQLLKEALTNAGALLDSYQAASTALKISIITFSGDLDGQNSDDATTSQEFSSIQAAKNYVNALSANGWTNYRAAVQHASADIIQDSNNPNLNGYIDRLYFISDGKPQPNPIDDPGYNIDNRLTNAEELAWRNLLNSNNVEAFMLNIGSTNQADINAHLRDLDDDQPGTVITVAPNLSNLQEILVNTINQLETKGNVLTNDVIGADGGAQVTNIFFTLTSNAAAISYLQAHPELVGATRNGATITIPIQDTDIVTPAGNIIHMDAAGNFTYTSTKYSADDTLNYTMKDKDGDSSSTKLVFDLDGVASLSADSQIMMMSAKSITEPTEAKGSVFVDDVDNGSVVSFKYFDQDNNFVESEVGKSVTTKNGSILTVHEDGSFSLALQDKNASFSEVVEFTSVDKNGASQSSYISIHSDDVHPDFSEIKDDSSSSKDNYIVDASELKQFESISMHDVGINQLDSKDDGGATPVATQPSMSTAATVIVEQITAPVPVQHIDQHIAQSTQHDS